MEVRGKFHTPAAFPQGKEPVVTIVWDCKTRNIDSTVKAKAPVT